VTCLLELAKSQTSANGYNYYTTAALEEQGLEIKPSIELLQHKILHSELHELFMLMAVHLDPHKSITVNMCVGFNFTDSGESWMVHVRHGVADIKKNGPVKRMLKL